MGSSVPAAADVVCKVFVGLCEFSDIVPQRKLAEEEAVVTITFQQQLSAPARVGHSQL